MRTHLPLAIVLAAFLALAAAYSIITPIFEAGDEIWHYPYVQHLAMGHPLPVQDPAVKKLWAQEGGQPPFYYALAALATFWIDARDLPQRLWVNPHAAVGIPLLFGNKNMIVHTSEENFPWHNTTLAVHLIRFLSILFSAATIAFTYLFALEIQGPASPEGPKRVGVEIATLAAALVAFNPMFIFISASVNNDSLAAMLAALTLLLLARLLIHRGTWGQFVVLGIAIGLAALTKVSDLGLVVVAGGVFLVMLWKQWKFRHGDLGLYSELVRVAAPPMLLTAMLVVVIAFWWYARNWLLYGDPFAFNVWVAIAGGRPAPATLATLLGEFQGLRISYWGNFGGVNIIAPEWVYAALDALTVVAGIGFFLGLARRTLPRLIALPAFWFVFIFVALMRWTLLTLASQGRLLFPAIGALAVLMAFGLAQLADHRLPFVRRSLGNWLLGIPIPFLFLFSALTPFFLIAPTYALPKRLAADTNVPNPIHIIFEDQAELVGYKLSSKSITQSELPITLYWRALAPMSEDFSVYIHLFDANGKNIGQWDAYPGNGLYPTRVWQINEIIVDDYRVPVSGETRGPSVGQVEVGLYRRETLKNLSARDPQGRAITPSIARFKINGSANVRIENPSEVNFEERIALVGFGRDERVAPGSLLEVRLSWRALKPLDDDYTVFVHLVDAEGKTIAQKDSQPQNGLYPTSFWDSGEMVADAYSIDIPRDAVPGMYRIWVGLYRGRDGSRLETSLGDHADLGFVQITR